jgi:hypothetical protein
MAAVGMKPHLLTAAFFVVWVVVLFLFVIRRFS